MHHDPVFSGGKIVAIPVVVVDINITMLATLLIQVSILTFSQGAETFF